ncbi:MAG: hypothetical protein JOZ90_07530 [Alphaproteobacteria bacterium]|nr:hypothetical protein [Alphaproteobacteria bacterium]MBV9372947.1 hypothetical protein [Alphaproteobacteria bacterium]MBV9900934.1 hypothetical protein [Alphaproteobacteria bacterium]
MELDPELGAALVEAADAAADAARPWWVIGSAAVALHGAVTHVADVDLLMDADDAARLLRGRGIAPAPGPGGDRFRSKIFARWSGAGLPIEVMADLDVAVAGEWRRVRLEGRRPVEVGGRTLFVPPLGELVALLRLFGRDKDLARAEAAAARCRPEGGD